MFNKQRSVLTLLMIIDRLYYATCTNQEGGKCSNNEIRHKAETDALNLHKNNVFILLIYTTLLILTLLTVFAFKKLRFQYIHESGLTLVYGILVGVVLKFAWPTTRCTPPFDIPDEYGMNKNVTKYYEIVRLKNFSNACIINYTFDRQLDRNDTENYCKESAAFDSEMFFNVILPPIIFNAGYSLNQRCFFRNIGTILTLSIFGTTISCVLIGLIMYGITMASNLEFYFQELFLFGAMVSATDPVSVIAVFNDLKVDVDLFAILFGESTFNNAVAIVLYKSIDQEERWTDSFPKFSFSDLAKTCGLFVGIFFGSLFIGAIAGCVAALLSKFTKISDYPILETTFFICTSYLSFLLAELFLMSGVVAVLFCGITQAYYTFNNLSDQSKTMTKEFFEIFNFLLEIFVFTYIGVSVFGSLSHKYDWVFIGGSLVAILVSRAVVIYCLSALLNLARNPKIPFNYQHMLFFAGLRGAVAFALANKNKISDSRQIMYTAILLIVVFTVLINGTLTEYLDEINCAESVINENDPKEKALPFRFWHKLDTNFLTPLLTHHQPSLIETMPTRLMKFSKFFTSKRQLQNAVNCEDLLINIADEEDFAMNLNENILDGTQTFGHLHFTA